MPKNSYIKKLFITAVVSIILAIIIVLGFTKIQVGSFSKAGDVLLVMIIVGIPVVSAVLFVIASLFVAMTSISNSKNLVIVLGSVLVAVVALFVISPMSAIFILSPQGFVIALGLLVMPFLYETLNTSFSKMSKSKVLMVSALIILLGVVGGFWSKKELIKLIPPTSTGILPTNFLKNK